MTEANLVKKSGERLAKSTCAITGREYPRRELVDIEDLHHGIETRIREDYPNIPSNAWISRAQAAHYRSLYVEKLLTEEKGELTDLDRQVTQSLATHETIAENTFQRFEDHRTLGERWSDNLATFGGSWTFIVVSLFVLGAWILFNILGPVARVFDPYPYILLNLILSCLAALQAPVILMSQKRQDAKDRLRSQNDYRINLKAELEIRHLHEKIDHLISRQWQRLAEIQQLQIEMMDDMNRTRRH